MYNDRSDEELVAAAQAGNAAAADVLAERYRPLVLSLARREHVRTVAAEMASLLWSEFVTAVREYDPGRGVPPAGWFASRLRFAAWNAFKRLRRRWQREVSGDDPTSPLAYMTVHPDPTARLVRREVYAALRRAVRRLPAKQRAVIRALYWQAECRKDIADRLGISPQAVSDLHRRALRNLRRALDGEGMS